MQQNTCFVTAGMGKSSFNNYVVKKRGKEVSRKSQFGHVTKEMSTMFHSSGKGSQNWVKFGPLMNAPLDALEAFNVDKMRGVERVEKCLFLTTLRV